MKIPAELERSYRSPSAKAAAAAAVDDDGLDVFYTYIYTSVKTVP